jgi:ubiquitin carboxyl-terminal hydrolase L5
MEEWNEISKDPNTLTEFLVTLGVRGCEIEEVYNLENLEDSKHVHGIILLYEWNPRPVKEALFSDPELCIISLLDPKLSVTEGILNILLNSDAEIGAALSEFRNLIMPLSPKLRAVALHNSSFIRTSHNKFPSSTKQNYFFTSYLPFQGKVVEIDGVADGPVYLGEGSEEDWLERAKHTILEKINTFNNHEVNYCLIAVINNKSEIAQSTIKNTDKQIAAIKKKLGIKDSDFDTEYFDSLPEDKQSLNLELESKEEYKAQNLALIKTESVKKYNWPEENTRKKYNYTPFILALLQKLNEKNQLGPLLDQAIKKKLNNN